MSDQSFHEIQLSGKQLVFFFMCAVVLTVVVFLFGVSVGREVRGTGVGVQAATVTAPALPAPADAATTSAAATTPPATQPAPNELSYAEALGGGGDDPSKAVPPQPAAEEPPAAAPAKAAGSVNPPATPPAAPPPAKAAPEKAAPEKVIAAPPPAQPKATPKATPKAATAPVSTLAGWAVQVGAYNANTVASKEVAKLQGRGYPAFVFTEADNVPGPRYKVRVGPYSAKADADRILKNLTKEGYKPLLKR